MPPRPPFSSMPPAPPSNTASSVLWSLAPLFTCGFATPFTMAYGAHRLRSTWLALAAAVYGLGMVVLIGGVVGGVPHDALEAAMAAGLVGNWIGGTVHSLLIRTAVFGRAPQVPRTPNEHALAVAQHRRTLRREARELAERDPALAKELRIGRPDLPRDYDDGGLIDVNRAPAAAIASLPGMTPELARRAVELREEVGAFVSAEDLSAAVGVPPRFTEDLAEYTLYLP
jgi:hypothetical protein